MVCWKTSKSASPTPLPNVTYLSRFSEIPFSPENIYFLFSSRLCGRQEEFRVEWTEGRFGPTGHNFLTST